MALLTATSHGALHAGWDRALRRRTLAIIFAGLSAKLIPDGCGYWAQGGVMVAPSVRVPVKPAVMAT
jgi:hypothetical protein